MAGVAGQRGLVYNRVDLRQYLDEAYDLYRRVLEGEEVDEEKLRKYYDLLHVIGVGGKYVENGQLQGLAWKVASALHLDTFLKNTFSWDVVRDNPREAARFFFHFFNVLTNGYNVSILDIPQLDEEKLLPPIEEEEEELGPSLSLSTPLKDARTAVVGILSGYSLRSLTLAEGALKNPEALPLATEALGYVLNMEWDKLAEMGFDANTIRYFKALVEQGYISKEALSYLRELYNSLHSKYGDATAVQMVNHLRQAALLYQDFLEANSADSYESFTSFSELGQLTKAKRQALNYILALNYPHGMKALASRVGYLEEGERAQLAESLERGEWDLVDAYEFIYRTVKPRIGKELRRLHSHRYGRAFFNALEESNADIVAQAYMASQGVDGVEAYADRLVLFVKDDQGQLVIADGEERERALGEHFDRLSSLLTMGLNAAVPEVEYYYLQMPFNLATYIPEGDSVLALTATITRGMEAIASSTSAATPIIQYKYIGPKGHVEVVLSNFFRDALQKVERILRRGDILTEDPTTASLVGEAPSVELRSPEEIANFYSFRISRYVVRPQDVRSLFADRAKLPDVALDPRLLALMRAGQLGDDVAGIYSDFFSLDFYSALRDYTIAVPRFPSRITKALIEDLAALPSGPILTGMDKWMLYAEGHYLSQYGEGGGYGQMELVGYGIDSSLEMRASAQLVNDSTSTTFSLFGKDILAGGWGSVRRVEGNLTLVGTEVRDARLRAQLDAMGGNVVMIARGSKEGGVWQEGEFYIYYKKGSTWIRWGIYKVEGEELPRVLAGYEQLFGNLFVKGKVVYTLKDGKPYALKGLAVSLRYDAGDKDFFMGLLTGEEANEDKLRNILFGGMEWGGEERRTLVSGAAFFTEGWKGEGGMIYVSSEDADRLSGLEAFGMYVKEGEGSTTPMLVVSVGARTARMGVALDYLKQSEEVSWGFRLFGSTVDVDAVVSGAYFSSLAGGEESYGGVVAFRWKGQEKRYFHISYTKLLDDYMGNFEGLYSAYKTYAQKLTDLQQQMQGMIGGILSTVETFLKGKGKLEGDATLTNADLGEAYIEYQRKKAEWEAQGKEGEEPVVTLYITYTKNNVEESREVELTLSEAEELFNTVSSNTDVKDLLDKIAEAEEQRRTLWLTTSYMYLSLVEDWFVTLKFSGTLTNGLNMDVEGLLFGGEYGLGYLVNSYADIDGSFLLRALWGEAGKEEKKWRLKGGGFRMPVGNLILLGAAYHTFALDEDGSKLDKTILRVGLSTDPWVNGGALMGEYENIHLEGSVSVGGEDRSASYREVVLRAMGLVWRDGSIYSTTSGKRYYVLVEREDGTLSFVTDKEELEDVLRRKSVGAKGGIILISRSPDGRLFTFRLSLLYSRTAFEGTAENLGFGEMALRSFYNSYAVEVGVQWRDYNTLLEALLLMGVVDLSKAEVYWDKSSKSLILAEGGKVVKVDLRGRYTQWW